MPGKDGRDLIILSVRGKGKSRQLVAPPSVGEYLDRVKAMSKSAGPDDPVFTTKVGKATKSLYAELVTQLLTEAKLREGPSGIPRSTYCFRHTYATFRLGEGVDVYFLAQQMGTSVEMIEQHYGHVNTVKHADRVLHGMGAGNPYPKTTTNQITARAGKLGRPAPVPNGARIQRVRNNPFIQGRLKQGCEFAAPAARSFLPAIRCAAGATSIRGLARAARPEERRVEFDSPRS